MIKSIFAKLFLFAAGFGLAYLALCYLPSMRIKLDAPPLEYLAASIKHGVFFKTCVASVFGLLASFLPAMIKINKETDK